MYSREPRSFSYIAETGTSRDVGPGLYNIFSQPSTKIKIKFRKEARNRRGLFDARDYPSVDHYNVKKPMARVQGCSTLRDTDARFKYTCSDNVAPNAYDLSDTISLFGRVRPRHAYQVKRIKVREGVPYGPVRYSRGISIPRDRLITGYTEMKGIDGLVQERLTPIDCSLGPAFYNVKIVLPRAQKMYKGCHWGKMKDERKGQFSNSDGPSPAQYDVPRGDGKQIHVPPYPLFTKRHFDELLDIAVQDNFPGPGDYSPQSHLSDSPIRQPFDSTSQRFKYNIDKIPGPGKYGDTEDVLSRLQKRNRNHKNVPFGVSEKRFFHQEKEVTEYLYHVPGFMGVRMAQNRQNLKGGFNVCSSRFSKTKVDPDQPIYAPQSTIATNTMPSASFNSMSAKLDYLMTENSLPSNQYDVSSSFLATHDKKSMRKGTVERRRWETVVGFEVGQKRFGPTANFNAPLAADIYVPGPGLLNVSGTLRDTGCRISPTKRFSDHMEVTPGPGDYDIAPVVADTALRSSWNVTLGNPLLNKRPMYYKLRSELLPHFNIKLHSAIRQQKKGESLTQDFSL